MIDYTKLDKRITFLSPVKERNDYNEKTVTSWQEFATVWASVWTLNFKEVQANAQTKQIATHRVKLDYLEDVTSDMRIRLENGKLLEISQILERGENATELELVCNQIS